MRSRWLTLLCVLAAILVALLVSHVAHQPHEQRQSANFRPEAHQVQQEKQGVAPEVPQGGAHGEDRGPPALVYVPDLHGDYEQAIAVLRRAGVIDKVRLIGRREPAGEERAGRCSHQGSSVAVAS